MLSATHPAIVSQDLPATLSQFPGLAIVSHDILNAVSHHPAIVSQDLLATLSQFQVLAIVSHNILDAVSNTSSYCQPRFTGHSWSVSLADHCKPLCR